MFHRAVRYRSWPLVLACALFACGGSSVISSSDAAPAGASGVSQGGAAGNENVDASAQPGRGDSSMNDAAAPPAPGVTPTSAVHCVGGGHDVTCAKGEACCIDGWANDVSTASCLSAGQTCETSDLSTRVTCDGTNCPQGSACCGKYRMDANGVLMGLTETYCAVDCDPTTDSVLCDIHAAVDICASFGAVCAPSNLLPASAYSSCAWAP